MQIGLTGATGFLGEAVVRAAVRRGHEIVAFSRDAGRVVHDTIATRAFSLDSVPDFTGCEAVIHLAGETVAGLWTGAKRRRIRESRIEGTRRVVEGIMALAQRPEVFVCASATGFYGDAGDQELTETSPAGVGFLPEVCQAWEAEARNAEANCRVVHSRFGLILGRDGGALKVMLPLFRAGLGGRLGPGTQWWSWIHRDDAAELLIFSVENMDVRGAINATAPWPVQNAEFTRVLAKVLRRPAVFTAPSWALRMALRGFADELLNSRRVLPGVATERGFPFRFSQLEAALRDVLA
jgi:uncharacterized protein